MALLINLSNLSKDFGSHPLFQGLSLSINEGQRLALIGPNGTGKSTLLRILAGATSADSGTVAPRKNLRIAYVEQDSEFHPGATVNDVLQSAASLSGLPEAEHTARIAEVGGRTGFLEFNTEAQQLSGGWRKRLAIAAGLVQAPDILLLDEPTNHLDLAGILWLEKLLTSASFSSVVVSHDRYFLENIATDVAELNPTYAAGLFISRGSYSEFLERRDEYLSAQTKRKDALENRVRTEVEWLRRGPKARSTKAKARILQANEMIGELRDLKSRAPTRTVDIDFTATERKSKRLLDVRALTYSAGTRRLFNDFSFTVTAGMRVGLVGPNGSGKSTLLRLLEGSLHPQTGSIERADALQLTYFDQNRTLDERLTLKEALAAHSDSVTYQERSIHVASWANRFLFSSEQLFQPLSRLSGGERARVLIAKLMLEPADVLLLDEPTNDLDIPTLEILEESLLEFRGVIVLVTHDRYLLDRVSTTVLGLDGMGRAGQFADYRQWEIWQEQNARSEETKLKSDGTLVAARPVLRKKLSYLDSRDYESIQDRIEGAEEALREWQRSLEDPAIVSDPSRLAEAYREIQNHEEQVSQLYNRWSELEDKLA